MLFTEAIQKITVAGEEEEVLGTVGARVGVWRVEGRGCGGKQRGGA